MKYVIWGVIALIFLKAGWKKLAENFEGFSANFSGITLDLSTTTPGKAVESLLGQGWANWVLWGVAILLVILLVLRFIPTNRTSSSSSSAGGLVLALVGIGLAIAVTSAYVGKDQGGVNEVKTLVPIDFNRAKEGDAEVVHMNLTTVTVVAIRSSNVAKDGYIVFWACPEVVKPAKLPMQVKFEVVAGNNTPVNHIALSEASQVSLLEYGITNLKVKFTFKKAALGGGSPCSSM